jgi:hypothetical protein
MRHWRESLRNPQIQQTLLDDYEDYGAIAVLLTDTADEFRVRRVNPLTAWRYLNV